VKTKESAAPRFFVQPEQIEGRLARISGADVNHILKVLRLKQGDALIILDGRGKLYDAVISESGKKEVLCAIRQELAPSGQPPVKITLVQGIPKGDKMDLIIQKGTELGVSRVIPLICERAVVRLAGEKVLKRRERWQRIALEAARQCRRPDIPVICEPSDWETVLEELSPGIISVIPWEEENTKSIKEILRQQDSLNEIYVFIGPEGGFTPGEVDLARVRGVQPVTLGPRILRSETAGFAALIMILYQWGDLGGSFYG